MLYSITVADSVPASVALTGTLTITNGDLAVTGSGTLFQTELQPNDWLLATTAQNMYKISKIVSNTLLYLDKVAIATDTAVKKIPMRPNPNYISVGTADAAVTVKYPNQTPATLIANMPITVGSQDAKITTPPIYVDPSGGTALIEVQNVNE